MMKSPICKWLGMISWPVTALACINMGLMPLGFNVFALGWVQANLGGMMDPIHYFIGLCGAVSLGMFVMSCMYCHACGCESSKCTCS